MKNKYLKNKIIKCIGFTSFVCILILILFCVYRITSKHYTMEFDVKVDNSQRLTVRLAGKEYDNYYGIDKIGVFNKGKKIQTIVLVDEISGEDKDLLLNGHTQSPDKDGCFEAIDVNFDKAQDFSLMAEGYAGANRAYYYFTWNTEKQEYEYAFFLIRSSDLKIENEKITLEVQCGGGPPWEETYGYDEDGTLQEILRIERELWKEKYIKSFVYRRIDGEMVFQRSEIKKSIDNGEELSKEEYDEVSKWLADNMPKKADANHIYFYTPHKKISFDDKEFYYVEIRWGEVDDVGEVNDTSRAGEFIITCDFTEHYQTYCSEYDKLVIYDYGDENI